ncbi:hypothetical protein [Aureitalea sp. L0-47]|uniref:hypothetical protein n=1 Tax=Aureitalea sp. L0-47 TaxID=2816962 RepID=UPI002238E468|nr:hypothetical protein [Aureitalea sp. L0-47]
MITVIFSLLAPAIIPLVVDDISQIAIIEINEEENKENKKQQNTSELEEKQVYFQDLQVHENTLIGILMARASHYLDGSNQFHPEIILPPPEHS